MNTEEQIEEMILHHPVCEYCFGNTSQIVFSDAVWHICESDCEKYGYSWAYPPYCGDIQENIGKCSEYSRFLLFSTVTESENAWDSEAWLKAKRMHEEITRNIKKELQEKHLSCYVLSTGCSFCEKCTCPAEPCRHTEQRLPSMESHGISIMTLADEMNLSYDFGGDAIVYFSMIFFK